MSQDVFEDAQLTSMKAAIDLLTSEGGAVGFANT